MEGHGETRAGNHPRPGIRSKSFPLKITETGAVRYIKEPRKLYTEAEMREDSLIQMIR